MGGPRAQQEVTEIPEIGFMQLADIPDVVAIEQLSFTTPWSYYAFTAELMENDRARYLVARIGNRVVGYIGVWLIADEGHITNLAVHPDYRHRGIGRMLLLAMIELVRSMRGRRLTLEVRVSNAIAQRLYESVGFVGVGIRLGYYQDNNEDALIMWKEL